MRCSYPILHILQSQHGPKKCMCLTEQRQTIFRQHPTRISMQHNHSPCLFLLSLWREVVSRTPHDSITCGGGGWAGTSKTDMTVQEKWRKRAKRKKGKKKGENNFCSRSRRDRRDRRPEREKNDGMVHGMFATSDNMCTLRCVLPIILVKQQTTSSP